MIKSVLNLNDVNRADVTAHSLRHTAATTMIHNGVDMRKIQQVLRHKSIVVTERYLADEERYNNNGECTVAAALGL